MHYHLTTLLTTSTPITCGLSPILYYQFTIFLVIFIYLQKKYVIVSQVPFFNFSHTTPSLLYFCCCCLMIGSITRVLCNNIIQIDPTESIEFIFTIISFIFDGRFSFIYKSPHFINSFGRGCLHCGRFHNELSE